MKNQLEVTNGQMSLNYKNNSLIHKFKIIMQIILVVVVVVVVNLFILYCVPHTIFIQISHKMSLKKSNQKNSIYFVLKDNFHSSLKSVCICLQNFT